MPTRRPYSWKKKHHPKCGLFRAHAQPVLFLLVESAVFALQLFDGLGSVPALAGAETIGLQRGKLCWGSPQPVINHVWHAGTSSFLQMKLQTWLIGG